VFFPLKLKDMVRSRSRGLLELGAHDSVPATSKRLLLMLQQHAGRGHCKGSRQQAAGGSTQRT
jgi:hypothetical protein